MGRAILLFMLLALSAGCVRERVVKSTWGDLAESTGDRARTSASGNARMDRRAEERLNQPSYAILLRTFTGDKQRDDARSWAQKLNKKTNMPDLWVGTLGEETAVYRGRYFDPEALDAMGDLRQTRMIPYEGGRPFSEATMQRVENVLAGPAQTTGATAEMDLNRYFNQDLWSLQVAAYNNLAGDDYQRIAEEAAAELRKQGNQAYYYHGKSVSLVTVGLFTYDEAWLKGDKSTGHYDTYSPRIKELQEKFPHNLVNGLKADLEKDPTARPQSSLLVPLRK